MYPAPLSLNSIPNTPLGFTSDQLRNSPLFLSHCRQPYHRFDLLLPWRWNKSPLSSQNQSQNRNISRKLRTWLGGGYLLGRGFLLLLLLLLELGINFMVLTSWKLLCALLASASAWGFIANGLFSTMILASALAFSSDFLRFILTMPVYHISIECFICLVCLAL